MKAHFNFFIAFVLLSIAPIFLFAQKSKEIYPKEIWKDNRGKHIQAHGGGIIKVDNTFYWFGEDRSKDNDPALRYVGCYSSKDLVNWKFLRQLKFTPPEGFGDHWVLERPKVYYNQKNKQFVMYFHLDEHYRLAKVGIAVSDKVDGDYKFVKAFQPLGHESRDIGQFIDDDGSAYLIFEDRPYKGFRIAKLTDDYMDVTEVCLIQAPLEGGAIVKYDGLYYAIGSGLTAWDPNPNKYATAKSLSGPWSAFKDIAPPETNTYNSQSTMMIKVVGKKTTSVIFMADVWKPDTQWDSRYLWMPLQIGNGKLWLPKPQPFSLNVKTGKTKLLTK
jgi:hypothetical protein